MPPDRLETRALLTPADVPPSRPGLEVIGTFNPAAWLDPRGGLHLLVRVAERPSPHAATGRLALPRYVVDPGGGRPDLVVDQAEPADWDLADGRCITRRSDGRHRLTFVSHLRHAVFDTARRLDTIGPPIEPTTDDACFGYEDPRVTPFEGGLQATVAAAGFDGVSTRRWSSTDGETWRDHGIVFCRENKDVTFFPQRIGGRAVALHRPTGTFAPAAPQMWLAESPDLDHWGRHRPLRLPTADAGGWSAQRVGGGVPPLLTDDGWLVIYHAADRPAGDRFAGRYVGAALLLDAADPARVLGVGQRPLLVPETPFERRGFVPGVVFPTGGWIAGDELCVVYGAADTAVGFARLRLRDVLNTTRPTTG